MWLDAFVWTLGSLALYAAVANTVWAIETAPSPPSWLLGPLRVIRDSVVRNVASVAYLLGIPLLAVSLRVARPSYMGLAAPSSWTSTIVALLFALGMLGLTIAAHAQLQRANDRRVRLTLRMPRIEEIGGIALTALLLEAHWALFRAGALSVASRSATLAVYLSLALLAVEAWSNPRTRLEHQSPDALRRHSRTASLAVLSGTVFLVSGSSILSLMCHLLVATAIAIVLEPPTEMDWQGRTRETPEPTVV
jgi:hypothetical protein